MSPVLRSIRPVVERARQVSFDPQAAARFARELPPTVGPPPWEGRYHFCDRTARTVAYVLVLDALNFCFWGRPRWTVQVQGQKLNGYFALSAALKVAFEEGWPLDEARYLAEISRGDVERLLAGAEGEVPLLAERWQILRELGAGLCRHFEGRAAALVERAGGSALELVRLLARKFPGFRDEADYRGLRVRFFKRAQIFCADLWGTFAGRGWGEFSDLDRLTAFADYKLPQLLRARGILRYAPALAKKVDRQIELPAGGEEEVEIRACTLGAVEELKALLNARVRPGGHRWRSFEVDWLLWNLSQGLQARPYHRTRTTFY